jgi:hypothetical protein
MVSWNNFIFFRYLDDCRRNSWAEEGGLHIVSCRIMKREAATKFPVFRKH